MVYFCGQVRAVFHLCLPDFYLVLLDYQLFEPFVEVHGVYFHLTSTDDTLGDADGPQAVLLQRMYLNETIKAINIPILFVLLNYLAVVVLLGFEKGSEYLLQLFILQ